MIFVLIFNEKFVLQSIRSKFWRLPAAFKKFVVLKSIFSLFRYSDIFVHTSCGASKGFMKALNAFKKTFEVPQGSVKTWCYGED